jgi:hypothetical protein
MTTIIFCLPGNNYSNTFMMSFLETTQLLNKNGYQIKISQKYSSNVYHVRNMCLGADVMMGKNQKPFQETIDYDYIFWIDSDVIFTYDHVIQLINHDKDIVSGLYLMDGGQKYTIVKKGDWDFKKYVENNGSFKFIHRDDILGVNDLFEAEYCGFGFVCIKKGVIEKMEYPWFKPFFFEIPVKNDKEEYTIRDFTSEDVGFCRSAINQGFKILVDPNCIVGHEKRYIYHYPHKKHYEEMIKEQQESKEK